MDCIARCRALALHTEEPGHTTRTFLSEPMRAVHAELIDWMRNCGMSTAIDNAGNLRGIYPAHSPNAPTLFIGSHLDTVPRAGAFDGILGVVLGIRLIELLKGGTLPFNIEILGFSEEEGVRFGFPFIGSRAVTGKLDAGMLAREDKQGISVADAIRHFGLSPDALETAIHQGPTVGYLEFHIEQGPVLESLNLPLGIVEAIAGQTRMELTLTGRAGHAGTTPMNLRRDALAGAAEWILAVERDAIRTDGLVATTGRIEAMPGAPNVIPGLTRFSLDVRHAQDEVRHAAVHRLIEAARACAHRRGLKLSTESRLDQPAVEMDANLTAALDRAAQQAGHQPHRMTSGAGHDAMILAAKMPVAMLFLRSPGGLSHHPDETVLPGDVEAALSTGLKFLEVFA